MGMLLFRLEHPEHGNGPFSLGAAFEDWAEDDRYFDFISARALCWAEGPTPHEEEIGIEPHEMCACASPELLYKWFGAAWVELDDVDFAVAVYEVSDVFVRHGNYQSVGQMSNPIYVPMEDFPCI